MTMDIKWFEKSGKEGDVVISSRIRLARNLQKIPFPIRMNEQQKRQVSIYGRKPLGQSGLYFKSKRAGIIVIKRQ